MATPKLIAVWDGEAFVPEARFKWQCGQDYTAGEKYQIEALPQRSIRSHNHFMAAVDDVWKNLRENQDRKFPSPTHLRRWALVECGYCTEQAKIFSTKKDALSAAASIREIDPYSVIHVRGNVLLKWTPLSMKTIAMDSEKFQKAKADVLDLLASMIGVRQKQLGKGSA